MAALPAKRVAMPLLMCYKGGSFRPITAATAKESRMSKCLLLWSVVLVLAGGAALAEPLPADPPLFAVEPAEPAPTLCVGEELTNGFLKPQPMVASCHGDPCTKLSD